MSDPYGYQNQYYPAQRQPQMQQPQRQGILWVQGEEGAKGFMVAPGNSVLLMDSEASTFYIKATDQSGMPQPLRAFDYVERAPVKTAAVAAQTRNDEFVTRREFDALAAKIEALTAMRAKEGNHAESTV